MITNKDIIKQLDLASGGNVNNKLDIEVFDYQYTADESIYVYLDIPYKAANGKWKFDLTFCSESFTDDEDTIVVEEDKKDAKDIAIELWDKLSDYLIANGYGLDCVTTDSDIFKVGEPASGAAKF